jgi:hypothetical protein
MGETIAVLWAGLMFGLLLAVASWGVTHSLWKADTVERGLAMYCPDDGRWAWNGECEK